MNRQKDGAQRQPRTWHRLKAEKKPDDTNKTQTQNVCPRYTDGMTTTIRSHIFFNMCALGMQGITTSLQTRWWLPWKPQTEGKEGGIDGARQGGEHVCVCVWRKIRKCNFLRHNWARGRRRWEEWYLKKNKDRTRMKTNRGVEGERGRLTGNRAEVEVVSDDLLVVVVHWAFREAQVEVVPQIFVNYPP